MQANQFLWWQAGIVYQIYPRSFKDSNGDGVGDLAGVIERLDYLVWLGVDAIWLSPIYPSPMADFGYDIADFTAIDPLFGDLATFDKLLEEAHVRQLKVILDFVPNHSSDEHEWFKQSRSSRSDPKHDWYIWRDPRPDGEPPNNWLSHFGGSAWEYDANLGQYYLHTFHTKQPDLNWRNPEVRQAMYEVMRFWFDRGVDGFRIDVLPFLIKDEGLRDNPLNPDWQPGDAFHFRIFRVYSEDQPEVQQVVEEMRRLAEEYDERVLIGEIYLPYEKLVRYYGENLNGIHLPFNFQLILLNDWKAPTVRQLVESYEAALPEGAWPNWVLGNHDNFRPATRLGTVQARVAQMLMLTLRGTPTCYYGDELGMHSIKIPPELAHDPQEKSSPGFGRDPHRTPMQWDRGPNAGFCLPEVTPWLPVAEDYEQFNVAAEKHDPASMLSLVQSLTRLRRTNPALSVGSYKSVETGSEDCLVYIREFEDQAFLVALNFSDTTQNILLPQMGQGQVALSTYLDREGGVSLAELALRGGEGLVIKL
jgi:alpha-glucosidase